MDAHDFRGRPGSRSGNKHPQQIHLLARTLSRLLLAYILSSYFYSLARTAHELFLFVNGDGWKRVFGSQKENWNLWG